MACEPKAIDFDQKPESVQIKVGGIVVAVGSEVFDATRMAELGYGRFNNVISNMEFERISDASGPTNGKIVTPKGWKDPQNHSVHTMRGFHATNVFTNTAAVSDAWLLLNRQFLLVRKSTSQ